MAATFSPNGTGPRVVAAAFRNLNTSRYSDIKETFSFVRRELYMRCTKTCVVFVAAAVFVPWTRFE